MTSGATIGALADELAEVLLRGDPFAASFMAISGYDDAVPDLSPEYQRAWRGRLTDIIARCANCEADPGDTSSRVLLETVRDTAARELAAADSRVYEFSVTTFPLGGPSLMLLIASRTQVANADSATAYLTRCRRIAGLSRPARGAAADRRAGRPDAGRPAGQRRHQAAQRSSVAPGTGPDAHLPATRRLGRDAGVAGGGRARHPGRGPSGHRPLRRPARRAAAPVAAAGASWSALRTGRSTRRTRRASGTARHSRSIPTSSIAWAWRPWRKSRSRSASSAARHWAPATWTTSWCGSARTPR